MTPATTWIVPIVMNGDPITDQWPMAIAAPLVQFIVGKRDDTAIP